ncbi:MAG: ankyrin repeat domain-containing protein, partial [Bacteroidaceae bacterium]|nr:ankyrin repeat domain-containing protein [Bacteroidaceae bacterium]
PLYQAAQKGNTECLKLLLDTPGIDVNKAKTKDWTPLSAAAFKY